MIKKLSILLFALVMTIALSACGSSGQAETREEGTAPDAPVSGGWKLTVNEAASLPEAVQTAFDKAMEEYTVSELKPVAFFAEQIVAGTNYMILCETEDETAEPTASYQVAIIYADLEGNASLTSVRDFDLSAYSQGGMSEIDTEILAGGWTVPEDATGTSIPEDAKAAFDKAVEDFTGNDLDPLALLGTQIVAGTNYAFLCTSTLTTQEPVTGIQVVTVYADLDGNAEITNISTIDPASFNE